MTQTMTYQRGQGRPRTRPVAESKSAMQEVSTESGVTVPEKVQLEMSRMKQYFPYRYVFAVFEKGEWFVYSKYTRHTMNHKARSGCPVFIQERAL